MTRTNSFQPTGQSEAKEYTILWDDVTNKISCTSQIINEVLCKSSGLQTPPCIQVNHRWIPLRTCSYGGRAHCQHAWAEAFLSKWDPLIDRREEGKVSECMESPLKVSVCHWELSYDWFHLDFPENVWDNYYLGRWENLDSRRPTNFPKTTNEWSQNTNLVLLVFRIHIHQFQVPKDSAIECQSTLILRIDFQ